MSISRPLPPLFEARMAADLGPDIAPRLLEALRTSPAATPAVRLNRRKRALPGSKLGEPVALSGGEGFYIRGERPTFAYDPAWHAGLYYVQDASSMAISAVVKELVGHAASPGSLRYLDACAAPGGKTIAATDALPEGSIVVANEFDRRRAAILVENLRKWGYPRTAASTGDTAAFRRLPAAFDIVAVDAPCSGEGMMRKEAEAVAQWSPGLVADCASLQREIAANVWEALKPGGFLIYSTCTFNRSENEDNVRWLEDSLGAERIAIQALSEAAGVVSLEPGCYRFMPGFIDGEGLFLAVLRKLEDSVSSHRKAKASGKSKSDPAASKLAKSLFGEGYRALSARRAPGLFDAIPEDCEEFFKLLDSTLDLRLCGTEFAELKGRDLQPCHAAALSTALRPGVFPEAALPDYASAIAYLRGESSGQLPEGTPNGPVAITWAGAPLGFAKNIGRRYNNLYPKELRLKTTPDSDAQAPDICRRGE